MANQARMPRDKVWRAVGLLLLLTLLAGAVACESGESPEEQWARLRGRGPYRGRVVDAVTKQPLAGAVVVAVWYYSTPTLAGDLTHFHDAVEVLTDAQGFFTVDAPGIERRAPRRTDFPEFVIFKPGYLYFRGWFAAPEAMAKRQATPLLGTVELKAIAGKGRKERLGNLGVRPGGVPDEKIPLLLRAMEEERRGLQLEQ
jgi:hypothetical protein